MNQSAQNYTSVRPLAAIYVRVSTEDQVKHGFSMVAQEDALKNYCAALGFDLFRVYREEGKSAKDIEHRPVLMNLLEDAEAKKFSAIFIYKLDRFSRSLSDLILTIERLKEWGVDFVSLQDKIETTSASGKLMFHIISAFAEFERNVISERTKFTMQRKLKSGNVVSRPPLGYKMVNKGLVVDTGKAKVVREIFHGFLYGGLSLNKLARDYDLSVNGVKKMLSNRTYLGDVKFSGMSEKGIHEPILDEIIFNRVQEKLKNNSRKEKI